MIDTSGVNMKVIGTVVGSVLSAAGINAWTVPMFSVPLTVIGMAALGAYFGHAYKEPEKSRKKLYLMVAANTFLATVTVAVLPKWMGWGWADGRIEGALAGLSAFASVFAVEPMIKIIPEILRKFFKLGTEEKK